MKTATTKTRFNPSELYYAAWYGKTFNNIEILYTGLKWGYELKKLAAVLDSLGNDPLSYRPASIEEINQFIKTIEEEARN